MNGRASPVFARRYAAALNTYLADNDEAALHRAYELGRTALSEGFGLLDLALLHHQILAGLMADRPRARQLDWLDPAALFFAECLSPFEMSLLGYRESNERLAQANTQLVAAKAEQEAAHRRLLSEVAEREKAEEALRQAQRLQAIGQLSGGIAHHFNNLLTVVMGNIHMARRRVAGDARLERLLDSAAMGAERGATVTRQLLAFSRRQLLKPQPVDPNAHLAQSLGLLSGALAGGLVLESAIDDDLWPIEIDPTELDLALLNLALNARDAMGQTGVLKLSATNRRVQDAELGLNGGYVVVEVSDTGVGIPAESLPRIFDPFFTTKGAGGTGLGLSQVHGFAHQSGGAVEVTSEVGKGARVRLYLPAAQQPPSAQTLAADDTEEASAAKGTVLVVDDDEGVAALAAALLEDAGFEVRLAHAAGEALDVLRNDDAVDLVFSDIVMPGGMDGVALAAEARRLRPSLPVLLTTGYSERLTDGRAEALGFPVLAKPYKAEELRRDVLALIERR